jgi:hypothetical protein
MENNKVQACLEMDLKMTEFRESFAGILTFAIKIYFNREIQAI